MFKRNKIEVVQPREYSKAEIMAHLGGRSMYEPVRNNKIIPALVSPALLMGVNTASAATQTPVNTIPTGFIADKSLEMLANVLDPFIQIMVAISFPVASVIMIGACFFFMFGNSEKAWSMIMNAGLGYVLIQISPLFLEILRQIGEAV